MDETTFMYVEIVLAVLAVAAFAFAVTVLTLIRRLNGLHSELAALKSRYDASEMKEPGKIAALPEGKGKEPVKRAELAPLGERKPAVVSAPSAAVAADGVEPEVVAAVMAAVTACGYMPTAIRPVRQRKRQNKRWLLAGRLAGMR